MSAGIPGGSGVRVLEDAEFLEAARKGTWGLRLSQSWRVDRATSSRSAAFLISQWVSSSDWTICSSVKSASLRRGLSFTPGEAIGLLAGELAGHGVEPDSSCSNWGSSRS